MDSNIAYVIYHDRKIKEKCRIYATRVLVEQAFGVLKRRFHCLHLGMATSPPQAAVYVVTCVVLDNIGIKRGDNLSNEDGVPPPIDDDGVRFAGRNDGELMRQPL